MLAIDVDGTLASRGDEVLPATREALHRARAGGMEVVIATGRRYRTTLRVTEALGFVPRAVCLGGALIKESDGRTLHSVPFSADDLSQVIGALRVSGLSPIGQRDHTDGGADFVVDGGLAWNGWMSRYAERNREFSEWTRDLSADRREDVLVLGALGPRRELQAAAERVDETLSGRFNTRVTRLLGDSSAGGGCYLEITRSEVCKWQGLRRLAGGLGIPAQAICAVGDEVNDLTMIRGAGVGVAMANGHPEVRAAADWTTGRHDEDGLVAVVERILTD
jgi:hydroxymethylpyrimidine pyrophosphatase-like HAD family hydrolase